MRLVTAAALLLVSTALPSSLAVCVPPKNDYDYETLESNGLVRPPYFWIEGVVPILHGYKIQGYETPVAVYQTMIIDQVMWECVAAYDDVSVSSLTFERPPYIGDADHHDSEGRTLCMIHAINHVLDGGLVPDAAADWSEYVDGLCLDSTVPADEDALSAVEGGADDPYSIGHYIGSYFLTAMRRSGWNFDGSLNRYGEECTGVCARWGDSGPKPYVPRISPFDPPRVSRYYQPLIEDDGRGFVYAQGHVTPHIGHRVDLQILREPVFTAQEIADRLDTGDGGGGALHVTRKRESDRSGGHGGRAYRAEVREGLFRGTILDDPEYELDEEADAAIVEVRATGTSDYRKMAIEFMDNKINLAGGMIMRLRADFDMSLEEQLLYHVGYTTVEHDSVVLAWREKVGHDLVRPTTIVQARGGEVIDSYRGPGMGVGTMRARDWNPYMRTMPHAEFPSGSGCICTVVAEYVDALVRDLYGMDSYPTTWTFEAGTSKVEPGVTPAEDLTITFDNMTELRDMCGDSRLWGGMHFRASIGASYELCGGIGERAYTHWSRRLVPGDLDSLFGDAEKYVAPME